RGGPVHLHHGRAGLPRPHQHEQSAHRCPSCRRFDHSHPRPVSQEPPGLPAPQRLLHTTCSKLSTVTERHLVSVETLMLRPESGGSWAYRRAETRPRPGESPDEAARRVCGVSAGDPLTVVHSTSWRHLPHGEIVLTYVVCPDPAPWLPAETLPHPEIARELGRASCRARADTTRRGGR